jgi:lauroyl/myristoyl acyltransferase
MDLVTPAYKTSAALAQRLPRRLVEGAVPQLAGLWSHRPSRRRTMVERHQRRATPDVGPSELRRRVRDVYRSYGRYWAESFRLPAVSDAELAARMAVQGYEHFQKARAEGRGVIAVLPHLGSWEWAAQWISRVEGVEVTAVVERLDPPALFEWFRDLRRMLGLHIVALGPDAARQVTRALKAGQLVTLLSDRDVSGGGVSVVFFGERTTLPAGPATLALRTGATILPVAVYDRQGGGHEIVVRPPLSLERQGSLRQDVTRLTQEIAGVLEELIRAAPEQWHLLQPNWPSDTDEADGPGDTAVRDGRGPDTGPSAGDDDQLA